jgi:hypothetical protein
MISAEGEDVVVEPYRSQTISSGRRALSRRLCFACFPSSNLSSPDQSASARHNPSRSGLPARICASMDAISARHWAIHWATL